MKILKLNIVLEFGDKSRVEYIQFKRLLEFPEIQHAYILKTNDMDFRIGKDFSKIEIVRENLKKVGEALNFNYKNIIRPDFEHTNNVGIIDGSIYQLEKNKLEKSELERSEIKRSEIKKDKIEEIERPSLKGENFKSTDGLITNKTDAILMSTNADCNLILIYDPVKKVVGNVHAGWKGTFGKIAKNAIIKMKEEYNCNPKDIICCFCPSIRKCHFEVEDDVATQCKKIFEYTGRLDEIIEKGDIKDGKQKYYIDTVLINKILLQEEGVMAKNIIDSDICSICHSDKIHSRRAEGPEFGLACALIGKKF